MSDTKPENLEPEDQNDVDVNPADMDIEDLALDFALQRLVDEEDFTLAGIGRKADGELLSIVIDAEGEDAMFEQVQRLAKENPVAEIALVGVAELEDDQADVLVVYAQTQEDPAVACLIARYELVQGEEGVEVSVGEWYRQEDRPESWVTR